MWCSIVLWQILCGLPFLAISISGPGMDDDNFKLQTSFLSMCHYLNYEAKTMSQVIFSETVKTAFIEGDYN